MTYNVFGGTLNLALSSVYLILINRCALYIVREIQWLLWIRVIAGDDATLACHLAAVSLESSAGKLEDMWSGGIRVLSEESQSNMDVSQLPRTVDVEVQCSPTMVDKDTAITDCSMVCWLYRPLLLVVTEWVHSIS